MTKLITKTTILLFTIILLAACVPISSTPELAVTEDKQLLATAVSPQTLAPETTEPTGENMTPPSEPLTPKQPGNTLPNNVEAQKAIELAQESLATKLDIAIEEIAFVKYQTADWRDGSMGCPQPGQMYTQAETSGYIIRLQVAEDVYDYHGGMGKRPFLCQAKPQKDVKPGQSIVPPITNK